MRAAHEEMGKSVKVWIDIATGTHHRGAIYVKSLSGSYERVWAEGHSSGVGRLRIEAEAGSLLDQRAISPAISAPLERYGLILPEGNVDWGYQADWGTGSGPVGFKSQRGWQSPASSLPVERGRVFAPHVKEFVGNATSGDATTSKN